MARVAPFDESQLVHGRERVVYDNESNFLSAAGENPQRPFVVVQTSMWNPYDVGENCPAAVHDISIIASGSAAGLAARIEHQSRDELDLELPIEMGYSPGECGSGETYAVATDHPHLAVLLDGENTRIFGLAQGERGAFEDYARAHNKVGGICRGACYPGPSDFWSAVISMAARDCVWSLPLSGARRCADPACDFEKEADSFCYKHRRQNRRSGAEKAPV